MSPVYTTEQLRIYSTSITHEHKKLYCYQDKTQNSWGQRACPFLMRTWPSSFTRTKHRIAEDRTGWTSISPEWKDLSCHKDTVQSNWGQDMEYFHFFWAKDPQLSWQSTDQLKTWSTSLPHDHLTLSYHHAREQSSWWQGAPPSLISKGPSAVIRTQDRVAKDRNVGTSTH